MEITRIKPLYLETALCEEGQSRAIIVTSADPSIAGLALRLREQLGTSLGIDVPVLFPSETTDTLLTRSATIVLGNMANNALLLRLYAWLYAFADAGYPGAGGYVVRSLHDPWGTGANVVILGGSDTAGVTRACDRFMEHVPSSGVLPRLHDVCVSDEVAAAICKKALLIPYEELAFKFVLSGKIEYAERFREELLRNASLPQDEFVAGQLTFSHLRDWTLAAAFDLAEDAPVFTDEDRLIATRFLLRSMLSEQGGTGWIGTGQGRARCGNHESAAAINLFMTATYFEKYYGLPEATELKAAAERFCRRGVRNFRGGADYWWHEFLGVSTDFTRYVLMTGKDEAFQSGAFRRDAERSLLYINNIGLATHGGESLFDLSSVNAPRFAAFLNRAALLIGDGRYAFMAEMESPDAWAGENLFERHNPGETWKSYVKPVPPADQIGLNVLTPVEAGFFHTTTGQVDLVTGKIDENIEKSQIQYAETFDKACFRGGLSPDDEYLLLGGINAARGHEDAGAVIEYSDEGRIWLVDGAWMLGGAAPLHNALTVTRDGDCETLPPYAILEGRVCFGDHGMFRCRLENCSGVDWTRTVFWRKNGYFVVFDTVTALKEGRYRITCHWQTLGELEAQEDTIRLRQQLPPFCRHETGRDGKSVLVLVKRAAWISQRTELPRGRHTLKVHARASWTDYFSTVHVRVDNVPVDDLVIGDQDINRMSPAKSTGDAVCVCATEFTVDADGQHEISLCLGTANQVELFEVRIESTEQDVVRVLDPAGFDGEDPLAGTHWATAKECRIRNADGLPVVSRRSHGYEEGWQRYPLSETIVHHCRHAWTKKLKPGDETNTATLLHASSEANPKEFTCERVGPASFRVRGKDGYTAVVGARDGSSPGVIGDVALDADLFVIERDAAGVRMTLAGLRCVTTGGEAVLSCTGTADLFWNLSTGGVTLNASSACELVAGTVRMRAGENPVRVTADTGRHEIELEVRQELLELIAKALEGPLPDAVSPVAPSCEPQQKGREVSSLESRALDIHGVTRICAAPSSGAVLAGCEDGRALAVQPNGDVTVLAKDKSPVSAVHWGDGGGKQAPSCFVGYRDGTLIAADPEGTERWRRKFELLPESGSRYARSGQVETIFTMDIDGDGAPEVLVGPHNQYLHCLDWEGQERWRCAGHNGPVTHMLAFDWNADGTAELFVGTSIYSFADRVHQVSAEGEHEKVYLVKGGEGQVAFLDGYTTEDGMPVLLIVSTCGRFQLFDAGQRYEALDYGLPRGPHFAEHDVGELPTAYLRSDRSLYLGVNNGTVLCYDLRGEKQWFSQSGGIPLAFVEPGDGRLAVVTRSGLIETLSCSTGSLLETSDPGAAVSQVVRTAAQGTWAVTEEGRLLMFDVGT